MSKAEPKTENHCVKGIYDAYEVLFALLMVHWHHTLKDGQYVTVSSFNENIE